MLLKYFFNFINLYIKLFIDWLMGWIVCQRVGILKVKITIFDTYTLYLKLIL